MDDSYIYGIVALLPLTAFMLTSQVNPYHALVMRGILGAVAALVYAVLGAADVALTEALVGTMLAITLYAVAVRSSLVIRLGVLKEELLHAENQIEGGESDHPLANLMAAIRTLASQYHLRLELVPYPDPQSLHEALMEKEVHAACLGGPPGTDQASQAVGDERQPYRITTRIRRLYEVLQTERLSPASLDYVDMSDGRASAEQEKHA